MRKFSHQSRVQPRLNVTQEYFSLWGLISLISALLLLGLPNHASALPTFARQTGQSCVACHAGGQFPELTPYGRIFKLTGYTIGSLGNPFSAMVVSDLTQNKNNTDLVSNTGISSQNNIPLIDVGSVFIAVSYTHLTLPTNREV